MAEDPARLKQQIEALRRQEIVLAQFGQHALRTANLDELLQEASRLVSEVLGFELVKVLELLPEEHAMVVRAGVNWKPGVVGTARLGTEDHSPAGYALQHSTPVVSLDVSAESRFEIPPLLRDHGVKSMANVIIEGERKKFGVLEVDARETFAFDESDTAFLQNFANFLAAAIDRLEANRILEDLADERKMLVAELQHRVKNILANVQALSHKTAQRSNSLESFLDAFQGRIESLSRVHDLLVHSAGDSLALPDLLRLELAAHGAREGADFALEGPPVRLRARDAQAMAMVVHELATNAIKYGALGTPGGRIEIAWQIPEAADGNRLSFFWRERGVAMLREPPLPGFGTQMIRSNVAYTLAGTSEMFCHSDGAEWRIAFPVQGR